MSQSVVRVPGLDTFKLLDPALREESTLVSDWMFAVADGIGGLQHGEVASRLALDTLDAAFAADQTVSGLLNACREADGAVWRQATAPDGGEQRQVGQAVCGHPSGRL